MASAVIGALRVLLGMDTANFDQGVKNVDRKLSVLGASFKSFAAGLGATLSGGAIAAGFKAIINHADDMGKMAQRLGIPVEQLTALKHAADLADVSLEELGVAVRRLSLAMTQIAGGGKSDATRALQAMGIQVRDSNGQLKSANQVLAEVADRFATMRDGAAKTALAVQLFGRSGAQLIPLLNQGSEALGEMEDEARQLGIVIDTQTARAAEEFNDNLTRLRASMQGVMVQALRPMLPMLVRLSESLVQMAKSGNVANSWGVQFADIFQRVVAFAGRTRLEISLIAKAINVLATNLVTNDGRDLQRLNQFFIDAKNDAAALNKELDALARSRTRSGTGGSFGTTTRGITGGAGAGDDIIIEKTAASVKKATDSWGDYREVSGKALTETKSVVDQLKDSFGDWSDTLADTFMNVVTGTESVKDAFRSLADDILSQLTRILVSNALQSLVGLFGPSLIKPGVGPGGMGFLDFGGPRQHGGKVRRGMSYLVGEAGPEVFTASRSGFISPNMTAPQINIIDQRTTASPPVEVQQSGNMQRFIIRDAVRKELPTELNRTVPSQFGLGPRLKQRA